MRWVSLTSFVLLAGCGAAEVQSHKLNDGSWSFTCELAMDECVRRVQEKCPNQRYRILEGTSETRLRDAPPFERAYHTSRLHLECNDGGANVLLSVDGSKKTAPPGAPDPATACSVGQTRECIGPGACKGGQSCLPDGKGFGACDCGPTPPATPAVQTSDAPPAPTDSAAPAPTPAPPAP